MHKHSMQHVSIPSPSLTPEVSFAAVSSMVQGGKSKTKKLLRQVSSPRSRTEVTQITCISNIFVKLAAVCLQIHFIFVLMTFIILQQSCDPDLFFNGCCPKTTSFHVQIIASILMPVAIQMLEFKSQAEMSHVPQPQEALQFGWDPGSPGASEQEREENAVSNLDRLTVTIHHTPIMFLQLGSPFSLLD